MLTKELNRSLFYIIFAVITLCSVLIDIDVSTQTKKGVEIMIELIECFD